MHRRTAARRVSRKAQPLVERLDARVVLSSAVGLPTVQPSYPTDPQFGLQWGLNNRSDVDVDAPEAWRTTAGSSSTIVAVLDSGIDLNNPEFRGRLWINPTASRRGRAVHGWNFVAGSGDVQDDYGHGTHVAGVLGAAANDGRGIVGVDRNARIMVLKVLDSRGGGTPEVAAAALIFAVDNGAKVVNASWATDTYSQTLYDAVAYADARGVVVVTAAGNEASDDDLRPVYPAAFDLPNILVVTAVDSSGNLADFANYGATTVDVAAPGVGIYSTFASRSRYATLSGTSMAVPFATGVVSLVAGLHPDWSAERLVEHVKATARPLASLTGRTTTGGLVSAAGAVGVAGSGPNGDVYVAGSQASPRRIAARGLRPAVARGLRGAAVAPVWRATPASHLVGMRAAGAS
ncbi:S8 family peptidase [Planctomyces sp. SH-PL62]|uniref:S8 family peptidase n=1 Tax=Planctomyces sp. SH-PL62 TaxID=1636152 RepID=UPI00078CAA9A|nr:S8 family peptidase [Planctomyces sp. SH-PL62]AMV36563.1 Thermophilic serine proteinase precursor [Planctomyces sp. SH-PL62]